MPVARGPAGISTSIQSQNMALPKKAPIAKLGKTVIQAFDRGRVWSSAADTQTQLHGSPGGSSHLSMCVHDDFADWLPHFHLCA